MEKLRWSVYVLVSSSNNPPNLCFHPLLYTPASIHGQQVTAESRKFLEVERLLLGPPTPLCLLSDSESGVLLLLQRQPFEHTLCAAIPPPPPPQKKRCNNDLTVLHIGNDFQRRCVAGSDSSEAISGRSSSRAAGLSIPLFLPLVPSRLRELNLSGAWTSLSPQELGTIRRGCRLKKLVATGVRCGRVVLFC